MAQPGELQRNQYRNRMHRTPTALIIAALLASGCSPAEPQPDPGMSTEQFIEAVVTLRQAAQQTGSVEEFEARRQQLLEASAITDSMLLQFVRVHGHDVQRMTEIWDSISARLQRPELSEMQQ
jgi:hypothetical protein